MEIAVEEAAAALQPDLQMPLADSTGLKDFGLKFPCSFDQLRLLSESKIFVIAGRRRKLPLLGLYGVGGFGLKFPCSFDQLRLPSESESDIAALWE